jgi:hypothetical protein
MMEDKLRCNWTVPLSKTFDTYCECNKIAKYKSPEKIMGKIYYLCGIHANGLNKQYKKIKSNLRCIPLEGVSNESIN